MMDFEESGMSFSFPEESFFYLEKSYVYQSLNPFGVSSVEGILLKEINKKIAVVFIEAKSTTPNMTDADNFMDQESFLKDVGDKFNHSLHICYAMLHGRYDNIQGAQVASDKVCKALHKPEKIVFLLIVRKYEDDWCSTMRDALRMKLKPLVKIWDADVMVLNEKMARKYKLIR